MAASITRRKFLLGSAATLAAPALLRLSLRTLRAEDFGLKADGRTDDLPALRNLLAEVERKGQGTIKLPAGRVLLTPASKGSALILPANTRLEGAGIDQTTLVMADGAGAGHVINAPFGWVQIAGLTIDANAAKRPGVNGHAIRFNGERVVIEHVRCVNAPSYGLAIAQKHYAKDVVVRDVEIVNVGADGIDVKNWLHRTEGIVLENITVRNFGRPDPALEPQFIGTSRDRGGAKAAVDLRGKCEVRGLVVEGLLARRAGLRFRLGDVGAHGSSASNIKIRGTKDQKRSVGLALLADNVKVEDIEIGDAAIAISVAGSNAQVMRGKTERSSEAALLAQGAATAKPDNILVQSVGFKEESRFTLHDVTALRLEDCSFSDCRGHLKETLSRDSRVVLKDCRFDKSCG